LLRPAVTINGNHDKQAVTTVMQGDWMESWGTGHMGATGGIWMILIVILIVVAVVAVIRKK